MKLGYLVPEFPGQTHAFFWREIKALEDIGIDVDVVSTRPPPREIVCHTWSFEATRRTKYLFPPGPKDLLAAFQALMMAGPRRWQKCLSTIRSAEGENFLGRVRLIGLLVVGSWLARLAKRGRWSHLHVHSCADSAYIALFANLLGGLSYSLTLHGPLADYGGGQRAKWRSARFALVITRKLRGEIEDQLKGSLPEMVEVAGMGVDTGVFERREPYAAELDSCGYRIFSCGRLHPCKGHEVVIRAVAGLRNLGVRCILRIAGEGRERSELEPLIKKLSVGAIVKLIGAVSEEDIRDELESAHIFALASLAEPLGVAIMEAMAMAVPVVVTEGGGVTELVRDGIDGLLVPPKNPQAMAEAIQRLLGDPGLSARMGQAGAKRVRQSFGSQVSAGVIAARLGIGVEAADQEVPA